ncbi:MAG TPA: hypothetical protein PLW07_07235, partial [bacterium]|nr:hypothetical protein [bacterium]
MNKIIEDRIKGCLVGSYIGAELGFLRFAKPDLVKIEKPQEMFSRQLEPIFQYQEQEKRITFRKVTPFIDIGVRAYLKYQHRVIPEEFALLVKNDEGLASPVFNWDDIHTIQEVLKEGMHPRVSGLGVVPSANICAAMPAVGIYHATDPEYAYVDGVELASVVQCRTGADWAGLCAATIAACLDPDLSVDEIIEIVMKIGHKNARDVFYQMNKKIRVAMSMAMGNEEEFLKWWYYNGGNNTERVTFNTLEFVLPLVKKYAQFPEKFLSLQIFAPNTGSPVTGVIAGAISGALYGCQVFPEKWLKWAIPQISHWFGILDVVEKRLKKEKTIINTIET